MDIREAAGPSWAYHTFWPSDETREKAYSFYSSIYNQTALTSHAIKKAFKEKVQTLNYENVRVVYNTAIDALKHYAALGSTWVATSVWPTTYEKMSSLYSYISTKTVATSHAAWDGIIELVYTPYYKKLAAILDAEGQDKMRFFIDALSSGREIDPFFQFFLKRQLNQYFQSLSTEDKDSYLKACCKVALETKNPTLISRAMYLVDHQDMLKLFDDKGLTLEKAISYYRESFNANNEYFAYHRRLAFLKSEMSYIFPFLSHRLAGIFELFYKSTQFLEPGQGGASAWDVNFKWELLSRFFYTIPAFIFVGINSYLPNPILATTVFTVTIVATVVFIYIYNKWLKPVPNTLPHNTENLTHKLKIGELPHLCGRDSEVVKIIEQFYDNSISTIRQHPLIIGESGVGKTSLINALVEELANPESNIQDELKGLTVFRINAAEISKEDFISKSRLIDIRRAIGKHGTKVVIIIDEIQELMKSPEKANLLPWLDTSPDSLPFFIGITSENERKETAAFQEPPFQRRFKEIKLLSTNEESTIRILQETLKQEAPEITVDSQEIFKKIVRLPKDEKALEPTTSKALLSQLQGDIRRNLIGRDLLKQLNQLNLSLKAAISNMVGCSIEEEQEKAEKVFHLRAQIIKLKGDIATHRRLVNEYKALKEEIREKELYINELATRIDTNAKTSRDAIKFLFERYYLHPAMKTALDEFAKSHKLEVAITEELIRKTFLKKEKEKSDGEVSQKAVRKSA